MNIAQNIAVGAATNAVTGAAKQVVGSEEDNGPINWKDYNFPPCLHLVHFSLTELSGRVKRVVLNMYLSFLIVVFVLLVNGIYVANH